MKLLPAPFDVARPLAHPARGIIAAAVGVHHCVLRWRKLLLLLGIAVLVGIEMRSSWLESRVFSALASRFHYSVGSGASAAIRYPNSGPYDLRLGYAELPTFSERLLHRDYRIEEQARASGALLFGGRLGISPIYHEKSAAGIEILDYRGQSLYSFQDPHQVYADFAAIPPLVVQTLLFIENRKLLDEGQPNNNPAIEWDRLGRAVFDYGLHKVDRGHPVSGGSTLATQLEKLRHSPQGRTDSPGEKLRQIASATLRSYQDGPSTLAAQREVICDYLNSIPLAATRTYGEVSGLGDGLTAWYGADFMEVNKLLTAGEGRLTAQQMTERGRAYRQVLSLLLALRRPSVMLAPPGDTLNWETDRYLNALRKAGVISPRLRDAALHSRLVLRPAGAASRSPDFVDNKATAAIRVQLMTMLGVPTAYSLDRLDLTAQTTFDQTVQQSVTKFLRQLADPQHSRSAGLHEERLLANSDPEKVIYSFTLYERGNGVNYLRAQSDTFNQPLNIVDGTRLQLGSTAKLRTLINYLQIIEGLHQQYGGMPAAQLRAQTAAPGDKLTAWALEYLAETEDRSASRMLNAALERRYSGSPGELFFTAGGRHVFANFERSENGRMMTVREAFEQSVNLVFIRLMRDIENYYKWRLPGVSPAILADPDHPARKRYLRRFADEEGTVFLGRFYDKYRGLDADSALEKMLRGVHPTPVRVAVIYRSARPEADFNTFSVFMKQHVPRALWGQRKMDKLYDDFAPGRFNLSDRGYLAGIHPLELWLIEYLGKHPGATFAQAVADSAAERQEVYRWLFRPKRRHGQDVRIGILLEKDAFQEIWKAWRRLGYPFDSLTPSYATAIGVSGDTPKALAELAGIITNGGMRYPLETIQEMSFARNTPMETSFAYHPRAGERVISEEIAGLVKEAMLGVVQNGTGRRAARAFVLPDGRQLPLAGKTGTGDNRFKVFARGSALVAERPVNRTAAFVFILDDRLFGTVMAFVPGKQASSYQFTSALAVQVLKELAPALQPLLVQPPPPEHRISSPVFKTQLAAKEKGQTEDAVWP